MVITPELSAVQAWLVPGTGCATLDESASKQLHEDGVHMPSQSTPLDLEAASGECWRLGSSQYFAVLV